jgi:Putative Ig domain
LLVEQKKTSWHPRFLTRLKIGAITSAIIIAGLNSIEAAPAFAYPACNPTMSIGSSYSYRLLTFTGAGTCTWNVPAGFGLIQNMALIGGGGGGGAGNFDGASLIGGGGGGGAMGSSDLYGPTGWSLTPGTTVTVTIGAGGAGGSASTINSPGGNGATGGATSWIPASGTSITVAGGPGGIGGSYLSGPVGGAGGNFAGMYTQGAGPNGASKGGSGYNGNGGGGAGPYSGGFSATTSTSGAGGGGAPSGLPYTTGGSGGTSGLSSNSPAGADGGSSSHAASNSGVVGAGGGGGAGCKSASACSNITGGAGASGSIQLLYAFGITSHDSSDSFSVGQSVNKLIALTTPTSGSPSWTWSGGTIPAGLSLLTVSNSDGVALYLKGTPTAGQSATSASFAIRDPSSLGLSSFNTNITVTKSNQSGFALGNLSMYSGQTLTLAAIGVQGAGVTTYSSNSGSCVLSGSNNSIITATSGTGTCTITASNPGDAGYNSATATDTVTLSTIKPSLLLTTSTTVGITSKVESLTATVSNGATGHITFSANGNAISTCGVGGSVAIVSSIAVCAWSPPNSSSSPYTLTAAYSGDGSFSSASTSISNYSVYDPLTLSISNAALTFGTGANLTVSTSGGAGAPSGWTWGISQASDNSQISGISVAAGVINVSATLPVGSYAMTLTAVDTGTQSASTNVTITVNSASPTPSLAEQTTAGVAITGTTVGRQINLVMSPGIGGLSFSNRATFYANGSVISGCSGVFPSLGVWSCYWSAANTSTPTYTFYAASSGDSNINAETTTTSATFPVNATVGLSYANISMATGDYATSSANISGGTGAVNNWTWGISQYLTGVTITGISIDGSGNVHVDPTATAGNYVMAVSGADVTGASFTAQVTVAISDTATPTFSIAPTSETKTVGTAISGYTVTNSGPVIASYGISPALPAGLSFDPSTGLLSGTPTNTQSATAYTITAYNAAGSATATYTLTIISSGGGVTITIALAGNAMTANYRTATNITAQSSRDGKVTFYAGYARITGCIARLTSSKSVTCSWKPSTHGTTALRAVLSATDNSFSAVTSPTVSVSVGIRTTRR